MLEGAKLRRVGSEQRSVVGKEPHPKTTAANVLEGLNEDEAKRACEVAAVVMEQIKSGENPEITITKGDEATKRVSFNEIMERFDKNNPLPLSNADKQDAPPEVDTLGGWSFYDLLSYENFKAVFSWSLWYNMVTSIFGQTNTGGMGGMNNGTGNGTTPTPTPTPTPPDEQGDNTAAIIGGCVLGVGIAAAVVIICICRYKRIGLFKSPAST